ncbi:MAG: hypothetical protein HY879_26685 [Deltaproteobacteria bacterium]|nr:hypothetical protein [Deltaproteobacteria bacterium]
MVTLEGKSFFYVVAAGLFITDPVMPEVRVTKDVDVIVEITSFQKLLADGGFREAIPGHLLPDRASQARLPRLINCMEEIAEIKI